MGKVLKVIGLFIICFALSACGGGSNGKSTSPAKDSSKSTNSSASQINSISSSSSSQPPGIVGYVADLWITGLHYETTSGLSEKLYLVDPLIGVLYRSPVFLFRQNDRIQFNIGNLKLPDVYASYDVTLFEMFKTYQFTNEITNLLRLLILINTNTDALVKDPSDSNPIIIPNKYSSIYLNVYITLDDLKLSPTEFESSVNVQKFLKEFGTASTLVSAEDAQAYFDKVMKTARLGCHYIHPEMGPAGGTYPSCIDADGDGINNENDAFPWDADEAFDNNHDGIGDSQNRTYVDLPIPPANGFAFSQQKGILYVSNKTNKLVSAIDITSGLILKAFNFDNEPQHMALSEDGERLYVALLTHPYNSQEKEEGKIAVIDLINMNLLKIFDVQIDPFDLTEVGNNRLVISSGSGQQSQLLLYDTETQQLLAKSEYATVYTRGSVTYKESEGFLRYISTGGATKKFHISETDIRPIGEEIFTGGAQFTKNSFIYPKQMWVSTGGLFYPDSSNGNFLKDAEIIFGAQSLAYDESTGQGYALNYVKTITYFNLDTLQKSGQIAYNIFGSSGYISLPWNSSYDYETTDSIYLYNKNLYVVHVKLDRSMQLIKIPQPCLYCALSTEPLAQMSVSADPKAFSLTNFDASDSVDAEDGKNLLYRWDIDGDGEWDSDFSTQSNVQYNFITEGEKSIKLQVKDSSGLTNTVTKNINVGASLYQGEAPKSKIFSELSIPISNVVHDKKHKKAYVTSMYNKKMYVVDLVSATVEREFSFDFQPSRLFISPDQEKVYMALVMGNNSTQWYQEHQKGIVMTFDTSQQSFVHGFDIKTDPYDMVLNENGDLAISSGSGQWTKLHLYNPATGKFLSEFGYVYQQSRFALSTSDVLQYDPMVNDYEVYNFSGTYYMVYDDKYFNGERVWTTPDHKKIIANSGAIKTSSDQKDIATLGSAIKNLYFDTDKNLLFTLSFWKGDIKFYDMNNYQLLGTIPFNLTGNWIIVQDDKINVFSLDSGFASELTQIPYPCLVCQ